MLVHDRPGIHRNDGFRGWWAVAQSTVRSPVTPLAKRWNRKPREKQVGLAPVWWRAVCSLPVCHFELDRALVAERRVPSDRIVEPIDVSGHRVLGLAAGLPDDRPDQFGLDGLEERLDHGVILLDMEVPPFTGRHMSSPLRFTTQKDAPPPIFPASLRLHR